MSERGSKAEKHESLIKKLMDPRRPKTVYEHAAKREIEFLRSQLVPAARPYEIIEVDETEKKITIQHDPVMITKDILDKIIILCPEEGKMWTRQIVREVVKKARSDAPSNSQLFVFGMNVKGYRFVFVADQDKLNREFAEAVESAKRTSFNMRETLRRGEEILYCDTCDFEGSRNEFPLTCPKCRDDQIMDAATYAEYRKKRKCKRDSVSSIGGEDNDDG